MSLLERDLLRRLIQDFANLLAAITGLRTAGKYEEAEQEIEQTVNGLLGRLARDAESLDSESLARLIPAERLRLYALLIAERANNRESRGDTLSARLDRQRALELLLESESREPAPAAAQALVELTPQVDPDELPARYRALLEARRSRTP